MLKLTLHFVFMAVLGGAAAAGGQFGTSQEAEAMLGRAVAEVKSDKRAAIEKFNHNDLRFRDRDLFVFCFNAADGKFTAHEAMVTHDVRSLRDETGKRFGEQMYRDARENQVTEVTYTSPMPGSTDRATRRVFLTRIGDQVCGVSAYR